MLYYNPEVFGIGKIISSKKVTNPHFTQISSCPSQTSLIMKKVHIKILMHGFNQVHLSI